VVAKIGAGRSTVSLTTADRPQDGGTNIYLQKYTHEQLAYPLALVLFLIAFIVCRARKRVFTSLVSGIRAKFIREQQSRILYLLFIIREYILSDTT